MDPKWLLLFQKTFVNTFKSSNRTRRIIEENERVASPHVYTTEKSRFTFVKSKTPIFWNRFPTHAHETHEQVQS